MRGGKRKGAGRKPDSPKTKLAKALTKAHGNLVAARKIAALEKHESYEEIGDAIDCVDAAFVWLPNAEFCGPAK